eukprot:Hpha_TRINITY_DN20590_c0_g1::TRINITY_DN20590_c0_g1_i1::g.30761::m.30761
MRSVSVVILSGVAAASSFVAQYRFEERGGDLVLDSAGDGLHCARAGAVERTGGVVGYGADLLPSRYSALFPVAEVNGSFGVCPPWSQFWRRLAPSGGGSVAVWIHRRAEGPASLREEVLFDAPGGGRLSLLPDDGWARGELQFRSSLGEVCSALVRTAGAARE